MPLQIPVFTSTASAQVSNASYEDGQPVFVEWWFQTYVAYTDSNGDPIWPLYPTPVELERGAPPFLTPSEYYYSPMPQPSAGHGGGFTNWMGWLLTSTMERVAEAGAPVTILIRNRNAPFPFDAGDLMIDPEALPDALDALVKLDYLFMDLEATPAVIEQNVREIVRLVRSHPNPEIANAFLGNYADYPGATDTAYTWEG